MSYVLVLHCKQRASLWALMGKWLARALRGRLTLAFLVNRKSISSFSYSELALICACLGIVRRTRSMQSGRLAAQCMYMHVHGTVMAAFTEGTVQNAESAGCDPIWLWHREWEWVRSCTSHCLITLAGVDSGPATRPHPQLSLVNSISSDLVYDYRVFFWVDYFKF